MEQEDVSTARSRLERILKERPLTPDDLYAHCPATATIAHFSVPKQEQAAALQGKIRKIDVVVEDPTTISIFAIVPNQNDGERIAERLRLDTARVTFVKRDSTYRVNGIEVNPSTRAGYLLCEPLDHDELQQQVNDTYQLVPSLFHTIDVLYYRPKESADYIAFQPHNGEFAAFPTTLGDHSQAKVSVRPQVAGSRIVGVPLKGSATRQYNARTKTLDLISSDTSSSEKGE